MSTSQVQSLYSAIASVPTTPTAFVNAYMRALGTGSGLYARAYLGKNLLGQIPVFVGPTPDESVWHPWITSWKILSHGTGLKVFSVVSHGRVFKAYDTANYYTVMVYGSIASGVLFRDKLTVLSLDVANPGADNPPYAISAQTITWLHPRYIHHF